MPRKKPDTSAAIQTQDAEPAPQTLRDCLAPLAAAALQTSVLAYQWGLNNRCLMRAATVMELAQNVVNECNRLIQHVDSACVEQAIQAQREAAAGGGA